MASGEQFAMRCRRYAELLRKLAKGTEQNETHESLLRFAEEFDDMAQRAIESVSASFPERKPKKPD